MTQNITFEDWEAEQMRDPEFRAATERLEPEYRVERRRMNINSNKIENVIQNERITELERRTGDLWNIVGGQDRHIKQLEAEAALSKEQRLQVVVNAAVITKQSARIEQLEQRLNSALRKVASWPA